MDFAAWMEVWLADRWWTFDPRNNRERKGRILIGCGRDASDVAMVATFGAPMLESMTVRSRGRGRNGPSSPAARSAQPGDLDSDAEVLCRRA